MQKQILKTLATTLTELRKNEIHEIEAFADIAKLIEKSNEIERLKTLKEIKFLIDTTPHNLFKIVDIGIEVCTDNLTNNLKIENETI